jgi:hypothetical protein
MPSRGVFSGSLVRTVLASLCDAIWGGWRRGGSGRGANGLCAACAASGLTGELSRVIYRVPDEQRGRQLSVTPFLDRLFNRVVQPKGTKCAPSGLAC